MEGRWATDAVQAAGKCWNNAHSNGGFKRGGGIRRKLGWSIGFSARRSKALGFRAPGNTGRKEGERNNGNSFRKDGLRERVNEVPSGEGKGGKKAKDRTHLT